MYVRCDKLIDKRIIDDVYIIYVPNRVLGIYLYNMSICATGDDERQSVNSYRGRPGGGHFLLLGDEFIASGSQVVCTL